MYVTMITPQGWMLPPPKDGIIMSCKSPKSFAMKCCIWSDGGDVDVVVVVAAVIAALLLIGPAARPWEDAWLIVVIGNMAWWEAPPPRGCRSPSTSMPPPPARPSGSAEPMVCSIGRAPGWWWCRPCAACAARRWVLPRSVAGMGCVCLPSYVVITTAGSWYDRSTRFFTRHRCVVHR
jgi:hypothetical protein